MTHNTTPSYKKVDQRNRPCDPLKRINLDDYIQTGEGATALTYTSKDGKTLAKLYNLGFEAASSRRSRNDWRKSPSNLPA